MRYLLLLAALLTFQSVNAFDFEKLKLKAEQGDPLIEYMLGTVYFHGLHGVLKNDTEAVKWFRKAADQGILQAQYDLGVMYANGDGVPENDAEAVNWYRKAADSGLVEAQYELARMYYYGGGVPENYVHAYVWLSMAKTDSQVLPASEPDFLKAQIAKQQAIAASFLDSLKSLMTKQQIAEAQSLAAQCYESDYKDCD